jgi:hypothetical protein
VGDPHIQAGLNWATFKFAFTATGIGYPFTLGYSFNILAACKVGLVVSFLAAISVLVWKQRFARRYLVTGWLWYLGTLVPVSGIIWMGNYSRADRYAYIPLIGIFVMVVWRAADWCDSNKINLDVRTVIPLTALAVLSFLTWIQVGYWQSDYELWAQSVKVEPNNLWAQAQLATAVSNQEPTSGNADEVRQAMNQAWRDYYRDQLKRAPLDPVTEILLVQNLVGSGHEADAIVEYRKVIGPTPDPYLRAVLYVTPDPYDHALTYAEIAEIAREAGDPATAQSSWSQVRESCKQVLKADPGRMAKIVAQWSAFVENNPSPWGYTLLGIFEQESSHFSNASAAFDKAHQLELTAPPLTDAYGINNVGDLTVLRARWRAAYNLQRYLLCKVLSTRTCVERMQTVRR